MSPKEDAFEKMCDCFNGKLRINDTYYFKASLFLILTDCHNERLRDMPWWWNIITGW